MLYVLSDWPKCECGCGEPVPAARQNERGYQKGDPQRFVQGHHNRRRIEGRYTVDSESGCWEWLGRRDREGRALMRTGGKTVGAYRVSYENVNGPIPEGLEADHLCGNPGCVNPAHIEAVTHGENLRRGRSAKLDWTKVREIRASDETNTGLAERYGVSPNLILEVRANRAWREESMPVKGGPKVTFRLDGELLKRLDAIKVERGVPRTTIVTEALEEKLGIAPVPSPAGREAELEVAQERPVARAASPQRAAGPASPQESQPPTAAQLAGMTKLPVATCKRAIEDGTWRRLLR